MFKGSTLLIYGVFLILFTVYNVNALTYGTTCATAVDLSSTIGIGAGFHGLIDSPFDKSWFNVQLNGKPGNTICSNNLNVFIASQQWVWYSLNGGTESYISLLTSSDLGGDTSTVDTLLFMTNNICASPSSTPAYCNDDFSPERAPKAGILGAVNGIMKIAIGQYATSSTTGVTYPTGKTVIYQYCSYSCAACNALPANLFYPNAPADYTTVTGPASIPTYCGTFFNENYYTFTAHSDGFVLISTCPTYKAIKTHSLKTMVAVYINCGSTPIACGSGAESCVTSATVTISVARGTTYTVLIGSTISGAYDGVGIPIFNFTCGAGTYDHDDNQNTACATCPPITNCNSVVCTTASNFVCTACASGSYLNNGFCSTCMQLPNCNTVSCADGTFSICTACNSGYSLKGGACSPCTPIPNCISVTCSTPSNSLCTLCSSGTYLNGVSCSTCTPLSNCTNVVCSTSLNSLCILCNSGSYLNSGSCSTCSALTNCTSVLCSTSSNSICSQCNSGSYLSGGSCFTCSALPNCNNVTCSSPSKSVCASCDSGYYVNNGACSPCLPKTNCAVVICTGAASSTCTVCNSGYHFISGICTACNTKPNCAAVTCTTALNSVCTVCNDGFYVNSGSCSPCTINTNCTSVICSDPTNPICTACKGGSYLNSGSCPTCSALPNCGTVTCSTSSDSVCTFCNSGFYLNSGTCVACTPVANCTSALTCSSPSNSVCTSCSSGSYLNSDNTCSVCPQKANCISVTCTNGASSTCISCGSGFYLNSGSCTPCTAVSNCKSALTCSNPSNSACTSCNNGYYINSGFCSPCLAKSNCTGVTCSNGVSSTCTSCDVGYVVKSGNCTLLQSNSESASSLPIAAIAGAISGVVILVLLAALIVWLKRRRNHPKLHARSSQLHEDTIPMSNVSISNNLNLTPSSSTAKLYEIPNTSQSSNSSSSNSSNSSSHGHTQNTGIYETPAPVIPPKPASLANKFQSTTNDYGRISVHSAHLDDYATPYAKLVLPHPSIEKDILFDRVIGNGSFGVVKLGRIPNSRVPSYCEDLISKDKGDTYLSCAVKTLKEGSDEKSKRDFADEGKMMANFNHPNVIRMVAVLLSANPPMLVTEFMKYGDLKGVLNTSERKSLFWYTKEFLYVAQQIAQGMDYLQSIKFIHRDLAARNCLVSDNLMVKISDFGLSKELAGDKDYYKLQTKGRLPVKWMAPESIGFRRFTHASDVWSFGVVMWEVFSYAHPPYNDIHPSDTLGFIERGERLECPAACVSIPIVYEWMLKCWEHDPSNRPSFSESVQFLSTQLQLPKINSQEIRNIGEML